MRLFPFLFVLFLITTTPVAAQEEGRSGVMTLLQKLGANFGQADQELLPPDEAFKMSIEVKDEHTLIAHFTPAKNYYLYFMSKSVSSTGSTGTPQGFLRWARTPTPKTDLSNR